MTGPEHYREAERLISEAVSWDPAEHRARADAVVITVAQVHATLALAAATAAHQATIYDGDEGYSRSRGWATVA